MRRSMAVTALLGFCLLTTAQAQPVVPPSGGNSIERVIVTAPAWLKDHPQTVIHNFVQSYAMAATPTVDEVSRWKTAICPRTYGLSQDSYDVFVNARIREIAEKAGAPTAAYGCRPNVEIVFTAKPQEFLDKVKAMGSQLLGPRPSHSDAVGTMRYPIQAWYATATRDVYGTLTLDDEDNVGFTVAAGSSFDRFSTVPFENVEGFKWREGLNSELAHIYIVADTSRTKDLQLGAAADYIAVLALSQTQSFDSCKSIPSITNLISPDCGGDLKPASLTDTDLAYLKAVYSMDPGASRTQQQNFIADQIAGALGVK